MCAGVLYVRVCLQVSRLVYVCALWAVIKRMSINCGHANGCITYISKLSHGHCSSSHWHFINVHPGLTTTHLYNTTASVIVTHYSPITNHETSLNQGRCLSLRLNGATISSNHHDNATVAPSWRATWMYANPSPSNIITK